MRARMLACDLVGTASVSQCFFTRSLTFARAPERRNVCGRAVRWGGGGLPHEWELDLSSEHLSMPGMAGLDLDKSSPAPQ
eukprot:CAMPEP_0175751912 /NCGR_PEP_ID=MMETSP0097-20121207/61478_1 /TAXON_ID=311494 /ORGANISM="Alexandrium monilatum, Strain CCMP3105" /LENGTH=79 /DNA_ID=CAMNT_0017060649 /DNA_START=1 /DNA_END=237 /DNA_ORIENTATION=-